MAKAGGEDDGAGSTGARGAQTLNRGLALLVRIAEAPITLADLADWAGLPRRTAARLVHGLVARNFVALLADGRLGAGTKLIQLGAVAQSRTSLLAVARGPLRALSTLTGLPSFLGRRDGDYSVHLHRSAGNQRMMVATPVGTRRRLAETSLGKALLLDDDAGTRRSLCRAADPATLSHDWEAGMQRAIATGVVLHEGPPPDSIRALAMPVRDAGGRIIGAISVAGIAQYLDLDALQALVPDVRATADAISRAMGWAGDISAGERSPPDIAG